VLTFCLSGARAVPVEMEVQYTGGLMQRIVFSGLPGGAVREGRDRIRACLERCGLPVPRRSVLVNFAPADLPKDGNGFDLPLAIGLLVLEGALARETLAGRAIVGELALDGRLRPVRGALLCAMAARTGTLALLLPRANGAEALVERDPEIRFVSLHQWPLWPGTGAAGERGVGNIWNVPREAGLPPARYLEDLWNGIEQATEGWSPDLVLVSAGYDSMRGDPLGGFTLEPEHYGEWVTRLRGRMPEAPIVAALEGGYAPDRVALGVEATLRALA
jgi:hypothetical protein